MAGPRGAWAGSSVSLSHLEIQPTRSAVGIPDLGAIRECGENLPVSRFIKPIVKKAPGRRDKADSHRWARDDRKPEERVRRMPTR